MGRERLTLVVNQEAFDDDRWRCGAGAQVCWINRSGPFCGCEPQRAVGRAQGRGMTAGGSFFGWHAVGVAETCDGWRAALICGAASEIIRRHAKDAIRCAHPKLPLSIRKQGVDGLWQGGVWKGVQACVSDEGETVAARPDPECAGGVLG